MLTLQGKYSARIVHCPRESEENQCVGELQICAYLHVTGSVEALEYVAGSGFRPRTIQVDDKILHQSLVIKFSIDFPEFFNCVGDPEVQRCGTDLPSQTPAEKRYPDGTVIIRIGAAGTPATTKYESGNCLKGVATFSWTAGLVSVGFASAPTTSPIPLVGTITTHLSGVISGGASGAQPLHELPIEWTICHDQDRADELSDEAGIIGFQSACFLKTTPRAHRIANACP